ncbi:hypothetical protein ROLI_030370 [Roseobacter fucihabitans]|uniref:Uncharacterized protein n=1 Tax=Roseobacter fucihabitans TaxID=1537242 RepID=A0ABZ2BV62_9RHOB|nr:hypothetical protein [Roseobacter litoralis]MBC6967192.1 hypothetical protein [Roseobacter litoralis]MBC6967887.1 hypothetical protein [Roseobacter litoralis]
MKQIITTATAILIATSALSQHAYRTNNIAKLANLSLRRLLKS